MARSQKYAGRGTTSLVFALGGAVGVASSYVELRPLAFAVCAAAVVFGAFWLVWAWRLRRWGPMMKWEQFASRTSKDPDLKTDWAWLTSESDLATYERLAQATFEDDDFPPVNKLRERLKSNDRLVMGVYATSNGQRKLEACLVVYPLRKQALKLFLDGTFKTGQPLTRRDIADAWSKAKGVYVALLVGNGPRTKARIKEDLQRFIELLGPIPILARPATPDGFRTVGRYKMKPIGHDSEVWILHAPASEIAAESAR